MKNTGLVDGYGFVVPSGQRSVVRERAASLGLEVADYLAMLIERDLASVERPAVTRMWWDPRP